MKEIDLITNELARLVNEWESILNRLTEETISSRKNTQNRTIKQILGHTIDSTSNNIHRIIHLQNLPSPLTFPNYASMGNNDRWIAIQDYNNEDWNNMIQLWKYSLLHLCHILKNVEEDKMNNEWIAGPGVKISLESLIVDFLRHLKLHLSEISDLINNDNSD
jgi:hypothetical protein